jgi:biopolymer transport protein ExbD
MMLLPIIEMKELQLNIRPASNTKPSKDTPSKTFQMEVLPDKFTVAKEQTTPEELLNKLKTAAEKNPDGLVILVSPESRHEQLAQALAAAKSAGIMKVGVQRITPAAPKAAAPAAAAPAKPAAKAK